MEKRPVWEKLGCVLARTATRATCDLAALGHLLSVDPVGDIAPSGLRNEGARPGESCNPSALNLRCPALSSCVCVLGRGALPHPKIRGDPSPSSPLPHSSLSHLEESQGRIKPVGTCFTRELAASLWASGLGWWLLVLFFWRH